MASILNKKIVHHLATLARMELTDREEEKLLKELQRIVEHFKELQEVDTEHVAPMSGGTNLMNIFRNDKTKKSTPAKSTEGFPEREDGYLKVPPVFSPENE